MAQIDDEAVQITFGVVASDAAAVDFLITHGRKLGLDREMLEAVPVVRFALAPRILERSIIIVWSAAPLDILQADVVIAINDGDPELEEQLDLYDLLPLDEEELTTERLLNGAGRAEPPQLLLLNVAGVTPMSVEGFEEATVDLQTGEGISAAINPIVSRVANMLARGESEARECPTIVMHASHKPTAPTDLQREGLARPGSRVALHVSLHEPFGDQHAWDCSLEGTVDVVSGLHVAQATMRPAGAVPASLEGEWRVELFRERGFWMLRSMTQA